MTFESGQQHGKQGFLPMFPGQLRYMQGYEAGCHYRRLAEIQRIRNLDAMRKAREEHAAREARLRWLWCRVERTAGTLLYREAWVAYQKELVNRV